MTINDHKAPRHRSVWAKEKPLTPWGTVPVLTYEGRTIGQSVAASRLLAREFGLAGKTNMEAAMADELVEVVVDLIDEQVRAHFGKDEKAKERWVEVEVDVETLCQVCCQGARSPGQGGGEAVRTLAGGGGGHLGRPLPLPLPHLLGHSHTKPAGASTYVGSTVRCWSVQ